MKRALKILGIVVVLMLVIVIALPFMVSVNAFRPRIEAELSNALGRQVKIGNLSLSVLTGSISADDLSIADDPAFSKNPFIRAKSLGVGVELMPLIFSKTLNITEITLDRPQVTLLRTASGKWNFSSLGSKSNAPASSSSANPNLSVGKLKVKDGQVVIGDIGTSAKPRSYNNVDVSASDFSFTTRFPFSFSASLPAGGTVKLDGHAGPIDPNDASLTPVEAQVEVKHLDLAASGFVDPSSGIAGLADFNGTMSSNGRQLRSNGTVNADKLKLSPKGSPAGRQVQVKYSVAHDLQKQSGELSQGDVSMGQAVAHLNGSYVMQGESTILKMKLNGQNMSVDDLEAMLPALGVVLPSGSSLKGGTLSTTLDIAGPMDKLVITGPVKLTDTKLANFNLGSKMAAVSALTGSKTGSDTTIQNFSTDARMAPDGISTQNVNLTVPSLGVLTGAGTISPAGALSYKMNANLSGGAMGGLTELAGMGSKSGGIPFFIEGTTSNPSFRPDVQGMLSNRLKGNLPGNSTAGTAVDALTGLFGKKKKQQ